jgi:hypothetical protein
LYPSGNSSHNFPGGASAGDQVFAEATFRANDNSRAARPFALALQENAKSVAID